MKKLLSTLGTLAIGITPMVAITSCGNQDDNPQKNKKNEGDHWTGDCYTYKVGGVIWRTKKQHLKFCK